MLWLIGTVSALYGLGHLWLWWGWRRLLRRPMPSVPAGDLPVSVVTCARNEVENLPQLYTCLNQQTHHTWEWLVVDDRSTDGSDLWLNQLTQRDSRVRVLHLSETAPGWAPKKWALQQGIHHADHRLILMTDADCLPPPQWVARMAATLQDADLVLGYSPYQSRPGLRNALVRYDTWSIAGQYLGALGWGRPYMAVGRSLAVRRSLWDAVQGSLPHKHIPSGDDDLLVHQAIRSRARIAAVWQADAAVMSLPPESWRAWLRQKQRHGSAAPAYPPVVQAALLLWTLMQGLAVLGLPVLWVAGNWSAGWGWLAVLLVRLLWNRWLQRHLSTSLPFRWMWGLDLAWQVWHVWLALAAGMLRLTPWKTGSTGKKNRGFA